MKNKAATFRVLKTCISALMFAVGGMFMATAQIPGIPYQAYIIDKAGGYAPGKQIEVPLANADILLEFEIRNENGVVEYKERIPAKTDEFGMVSTVIGVGNGTPTEGAFEDIVWNGKPKKMHIDSDLTGTGSNFNDHGEMELVHIPGPSGVVITPGIGAPTATNPAGPNAGDIYVDEATGDLYTFDGTNWVPQPGVAINPGAGAPTATNPANPDSGDMYVDESTGEIYVYDGTSWVNTVDANETVTTLVDNGDGTSTYTDENNQPNPITNTVTAANASIADGTIDIDGDGTADNNVTLQDVTDNINNIIAANETLTSLTQNTSAGTLTYTGEDGISNTFEVLSFDAGNVVTVGSDGGIYINQATIAANETDTSLAQDLATGVITYTAEDGLPDTANVVSATPGNIVTVGTDGGAFVNQAALNEPWYTVGTTTGHTTNTGDMFYSGNIGVGTGTLTAGKVATFAGDVDIQGVLDPTKIIMSGDGSIGSFNPTTNNQYEIEFQEGRDLEIKSNTTNNIMHIENTGNVGVRTAAPAYSLDVNGSFKNNNSGLFSVMGGNDDDVANTTAGGAPKRGIYMWDASNTNWGIYMSRPGIGKSLSSGDATRGNNFANHALRFRASDSNSNGFIFENTNEDLLVSIRSSDGYAFFGGQLQVHSLPTGTATDQVVVADSWGILRKRTTCSLAKDNEPWFGDDDDAGASSNTEDIYHMGQVGIGVNDPTSKLDVNGAVRVRVLPSGVPSDQIVTVRSDGSLRKAPASALEIPSNASAGTITSTANQIFGGSGWKYLGASITISPGKWAITGIFQFSVANGPVRTGTDQYRHILVEPSISASSRNTTGLTLFSKFITLTSTLYAGALNGVFWGQARGTIVVRNNTTSNKTIYFGVQDYPQYSKMRYLGSYGENTLSAIELAN